MVTIFTVEGETVKHQTQQYEVGLYCVIYVNDKMISQDAYDTKEESYHKKLRARLKKDKVNWTE